MKQLVIVGTGAVAAEMTAYLEHPQYGPLYDVKIKGYLDINSNHVSEYEYQNSYLGRIEDYDIQEEDYFIVAIGNNIYRKANAEKLLQKNAKFINLIHPTCLIANTAKIGKGNILYPFTQIGPKVQLGDFNILTSESVISHDCIIGDFNFFAISTISGHVIIGNENNFYTHSAVVPKISIKNKNVIQAGMIIDKDIGDDTTVFYRFKEKVMAIPKESL